MKIRFLLIAAVLATAILCFGGAVKAQTPTIAQLLAQIQALTTQIQALQAQLQTLQNQQNPTSTAWCHTFNAYLKLGSIDADPTSGNGDVASLQRVFAFEKLPGVTSEISGTFDQYTQTMLKEFQKRYRIGQTGTTGPQTRTELDSLYGCKITTCTADSDCASGQTCIKGSCVNSTQGTLATPTINMAATTPSQYIAVGSGGLVNASQVTYDFVSNGGSSTITELKFHVSDLASNPLTSVTNICNGPVCAQPVNGVADLTGLNLTIDAGTSPTSVGFHISYAGVGPNEMAPNTLSAVGLSYVKYVSGGITSVFNTTSPIYAPNVYLVGSVPTVTVPTGNTNVLIVGAQNQIGSATVAASTQGAIKINTIVFGITGSSGAGFVNGYATISNPTINVNGVPVANAECQVTSVTINCMLGNGFASDFVIPAGQTINFSLYATISGATIAGANPTVSTGLGPLGFIWDDTSTNGASGMGLTGSLIYNFPTNSYTISQGSTPVAQPTITITSPNGGEQWQLPNSISNSIFTVKFNSSGFPVFNQSSPLQNDMATAYLKFSDGAMCKLSSFLIASNINNTSSPFNLYNGMACPNISRTVTLGGGYKIAIAVGDPNGNQIAYDESDNAFSLVPLSAGQPSVTVTSLNSPGLGFPEGQVINITWTSQNLKPGGTFNISLIDDKNRSGTIVNNLPATQNSYAWTVAVPLMGYGVSDDIYKTFGAVLNPGVDLGNYKVSVYYDAKTGNSVDNAGATNNNYFKIYNASGTCKSDADCPVSCPVCTTGVLCSNACTQQRCINGQCGGSNSNLPPVISGVSGPTTLNVGQTGTWTISASDPQNGTLSYSVYWGDQIVPLNPSSSAAGNYTQTATFTHSYSKAGNYTIKFYVRDTAGLTASSSISVNIGNSTKSPLKVVSPNGGEKLTIGQTYNITWNPGDYPNVNVVIGIQDTKFYQGYVGITQAIPNTGSYQWTVALPIILTGPAFQPDNNYLISIGNAYNTNGYYESDTSDAPFSIVAPTVASCTDTDVSTAHPDGVDIYTQGTITGLWNGTPTTEKDFCLQLKNGQWPWNYDPKWNSSDAFSNSNLYPTCTSDCGIYEFSCNSTYSPGSGTNIYTGAMNCPGGCANGACLPVATLPTITVTSPTGGTFSVGQQMNITWQNTNVPSVIDIYLMSKSNPNTHYSSWQIGNLAMPNTGSYLWTIPQSISPANNYFIEVTLDVQVPQTGEDTYADSATFSITNSSIPPTITNIFPSSGAVNSSVVITGANFTPTGNQITQFCGSSGGGGAANVSSADGRTLTFNIPSPTVITGTTLSYPLSCTISVADANGTSNQFPFTVTSPSITPTITVISPNGGESWAQGSTHNVTWTSSGTLSTDSVMIVLDNYSGSTVNYGAVFLTTNSPVSPGSFSWTVPTSLSGTYKARAMIMRPNSSGGGGEVARGQSANTFSIVAPTGYQGITLINPVPGSSLAQGSAQTATWTGSDSGVTSYSVYLIGGSLGNTGSLYLGQANASTKSFNWTVPTTVTAGSGYNLSFSGAGATGNTPTAATSFNIIAAPTTQPTVTVVSPNGGEAWKIGETHNITWTSSGINNVGIELWNADNSARICYLNNDQSVPASQNSYSFAINTCMNSSGQTISIVPGNYKIRVSSFWPEGGEAGFADVSDNYFSIVASAPTPTPTVSLSATIVSSSTTPSQYIAVGSNGATNASQATFNFVATGGTATITELKFSATNNSVTNICAGNICAQPVNGAADLTGLQLSVPNGGGGITQGVQISYAGAGPAGLAPGTTSTVALFYVGYTAGTGSSSISPNINAPMITLVGSAPVVTVNQTPASGLIVGAQNQIGQVAIAASPQGAIKVRQITFYLGSSGLGNNFGIASPTLNINNVPVSGANCTINGAPGSTYTAVCAFSGSYANDYMIPAGQSQTFGLFATVNGTPASGANPSVTTSLASAGFVWDDTSTNGASGTGLTGSLVYNFPTNNYTISSGTPSTGMNVSQNNLVASLLAAIQNLENQISLLEK
jgi:hypothetical protein